MSDAICLSWNSSKIRQPYCFRSGSEISSRRSMPSVSNTILVFELVRSSSFTRQPVSPPNCVFLSVETRAANILAASLRGCNTAILPFILPLSSRICGTCVDLPDPGGEDNTILPPGLAAFRISCLCSNIGRFMVCCFVSYALCNCDIRNYHTIAHYSLLILIISLKMVVLSRRIFRGCIRQAGDFCFFFLF